GKPQLRKNHHGKVPLEPEYCTSEGFLQRGDHLRWVNWLVTHNAVFLKKVADVDAPFNPIRKYLGDPGAYSTLLQMATAAKAKPGPGDGGGQGVVAEPAADRPRRPRAIFGRNRPVGFDGRERGAPRTANDGPLAGPPASSHQPGTAHGNSGPC